MNISPDHIGPNEHPTFADYLHCKEQLLVNSRTCIINAETDYLDDVYYTAKLHLSLIMFIYTVVMDLPIQ